jgi:DNA-binding beta-propeller fold protein YncE
MMLSLSKRVPLVAIALLAIGGATTVAAQSATAQAENMFLSNGTAVQIFAINNQEPGQAIGEIQSSEAEGLAIDGNHLFVARQSHWDVPVYDTSSLKQIGLLRDPGQQPNSIAVKGSKVYVGNMYSARGGAGSVSVYEQGTRTKVLHCSSFVQVTGVAVNGRGDVFVNQNKSGGGGEVDVFPAGSDKCQSLPAVSEYSAGGVAIDPATNNLIVADSGYRRIFVLAPPYNSIEYTIQLSVCEDESVSNLTIDPATSLLYVANPYEGANALSYPGGSLMATYTMSSPIGIAIHK